MLSFIRDNVLSVVCGFSTAVSVVSLIFTEVTWSNVEDTHGLRGFNGSQGPQGSGGPHGFNGSQALRGFQGPKGPPGSRGLQGQQGPQGPSEQRGPRGRQRRQGPSGTVRDRQGPSGTVMDRQDQEVHRAVRDVRDQVFYVTLTT